MRELKREEYGMISGGIDTTNLHAVRVDGPASSDGGFYLSSSGTGNGPRGGESGGGGGRHIKNPSACANGALASGGFGAAVGAAVGAVIGLGVGSPATALIGALLGTALFGSGASAVALHGSACRP